MQDRDAQLSVRASSALCQCAQEAWVVTCTALLPPGVVQCCADPLPCCAPAVLCLLALLVTLLLVQAVVYSQRMLELKFVCRTSLGKDSWRVSTPLLFPQLPDNVDDPSLYKTGLKAHSAAPLAALAGDDRQLQVRGPGELRRKWGMLGSGWLHPAFEGRWVGNSLGVAGLCWKWHLSHVWAKQGLGGGCSHLSTASWVGWLGADSRRAVFCPVLPRCCCCSTGCPPCLACPGRVCRSSSAPQCPSGQTPPPAGRQQATSS